LIEVAATGLVAPPVVLPLNATPIYAIEIPDANTDLEALAARHPDRERALVRYSLAWAPDAGTRDEFCQRVERLFPRWYDRQIPTASDATAPETIGALADVAGTTRAYLRDVLAEHPEREAVLTLAETYLANREVLA
jgi:exonuclease SbcD